MNPFTGEIISKLEFDDNEAAYSFCFCSFGTHESYLAVGVASNVQFKDKSESHCGINLYLLGEDASLELVYKVGLPIVVIRHLWKVSQWPWHPFKVDC